MDGRSSKSFMHSITLSFSVNPALNTNIHSNALCACLCAESLKPNLQMHVMGIRAAVWWEETVEQTLPLVHSSSVSAVRFAFFLWRLSIVWFGSLSVKGLRFGYFLLGSNHLIRHVGGECKLRKGWVWAMINLYSHLKSVIMTMYNSW